MFVRRVIDLFGLYYCLRVFLKGIKYATNQRWPSGEHWYRQQADATISPDEGHVNIKGIQA